MTTLPVRDVVAPVMRVVISLAFIILATGALGDVKHVAQPSDCWPRWQRPIAKLHEPRSRICPSGYMSIVTVPLERDHEMTSYRSSLPCGEVRALLEPWQLEQFKCVDFDPHRPEVD